MRLLTAVLIPVLVLTAACGDGGDTTAPTVEPTTEPDQTQPADVAVTIEGERAGLERACQGADGAVVAVTTAGRRVILVREEGLAIRLSTEGDTFTETTDVTETEVGVTNVYEGSVPVEGQPTPVSIEVRDDVDLETCEQLQE